MPTLPLFHADRVTKFGFFEEKINKLLFIPNLSFFGIILHNNVPFSAFLKKVEICSPHQ